MTKPSLFLILLSVAVTPLCLAEVFDRDTNSASTPPPACSLSCLTTIVPQYCSVTDIACVCTNTQLAAASEICVYEACNITDILLLARYQADSCGITNDKGRQINEFQITESCPPLATLFVAARVFARTRFEAGLWIDDYLMIGALLVYLTQTGTGLVVAIQGFGQHTWYLSPANLTKSLEFLWYSELLYMLSLTLTKLSLLVFFRRVFPSKAMRLATLYFGIFVLISNLALFMAVLFQCVPFYANWTNWMYKVAPTKCLDTFVILQVAAAIDIFHDTVIMIMPLPTLWDLNLPLRKKANVFAMFMVGIVVIISSALRIPTLLQPAAQSDPSWDSSTAAVWTSLETSVGIICGCLPACRSLVGWLFPTTKMNLRKTSDYSRGYMHSRSRTTAVPRSFVELTDRTKSNEDLEDRGMGSRNKMHSGVDLVPYDEDMGTRTVVESKDLGGPTSLSDNHAGITITTQVVLEQERR